MFNQRENRASELIAFARFLVGLPRLVRRRLTVANALAIVQERLRRRDSNFLDVLDRSVYANPDSPYRKLLDAAGCTQPDIREMITRLGLEATLLQLRHAGVYVRFEEFKGLQPIVRGSTVIHVMPADFDNPATGRYYSTTTGGSTGAGRRVRLDLAHIEALLPGRIMVRHVQGVTGIPSASWSDLPPAGGLLGVLLHAAAGEEATHWYCARVGASSSVPLRFRLATTTALTVARAAGASVRWPKHLPFDQAVALAHWAHEQVKRTGACTVHASVSRILRIAIAAEAHGIDLTGTVLRGGAEPPTPAKVARIRRTGATFFSSYSFSEVGTVGSACLTSAGANDQHFMQDHLAMIQASRPVPGFAIEVPAFCFTTLLPTAPKLMLNVESDDYGTGDNTPCGCPWERLGFPTHLRDIRSFRKLTGEGVTMVGSDMERILDDVLPRKYGGSALDYQFAEEENADGFTCLILRVAPAIELGHETAAVEFVLQALQEAGAAGGIASATWKAAGSLRIRRQVPTMTGRGKLLPLDARTRAS